MARDGQSNALQTIFSFFLGLMVLAFIGIGVNTFYPQQTEKYQEELQKLSRQQEIAGAKPGAGTPEQQAEQRRILDRMDAVQKKQQAEQKIWARNTSIVLIIFATIVMAVSLIRSEQLRVISNGLLLGGLFTMVYGTGWVIFSGESTARFLVIVFALAVTVALGYVKFVRGREERTPPGAAGAEPQGPELAALEARVGALEARQAAAAEALRSE